MLFNTTYATAREFYQRSLLFFKTIFELPHNLLFFCSMIIWLSFSWKARNHQHAQLRKLVAIECIPLGMNSLRSSAWAIVNPPGGLKYVFHSILFNNFFYGDDRFVLGKNPIIFPCAMAICCLNIRILYIMTSLYDIYWARKQCSFRVDNCSDECNWQNLLIVPLEFFFLACNRQVYFLIIRIAAMK